MTAKPDPAKDPTASRESLWEDTPAEPVKPFIDVRWDDFERPPPEFKNVDAARLRALWEAHQRNMRIAHSTIAVDAEPPPETPEPRVPKVERRGDIEFH